MTTYTVWVGGIEVNPGYLSKVDADRLATVWRESDYDDVIVQEVTLGATTRVTRGVTTCLMK